MLLLSEDERHLGVLFVRDEIFLLLALVVLCEERRFFLTVGAFEMVDALVQDTEAFGEIALFFVELLDLEADKLVGVVLVDIL